VLCIAIFLLTIKLARIAAPLVAQFMLL
jgi:hypothetical protein